MVDKEPAYPNRIVMSGSLDIFSSIVTTLAKLFPWNPVFSIKESNSDNDLFALTSIAETFLPKLNFLDMT